VQEINLKACTQMILTQVICPDLRFELGQCWLPFRHSWLCPVCTLLLRD